MYLGVLGPLGQDLHVLATRGLRFLSEGSHAWHLNSDESKPTGTELEIPLKAT